MGDLGNCEADAEGKVNFEITDHLISLVGQVRAQSRHEGKRNGKRGSSETWRSARPDVSCLFLSPATLFLLEQHSIIGRSIIVHEQVDDLGKVNNNSSFAAIAAAFALVAAPAPTPLRPDLAWPQREFNALAAGQPLSIDTSCSYCSLCCHLLVLFAISRAATSCRCRPETPADAWPAASSASSSKARRLVPAHRLRSLPLAE